MSALLEKLNTLPPLWCSEDVRDVTKGRGDSIWQAFGVSIDSREVTTGDLFIALRGERHDAHKFLPQAFENGAAAALVSADAPAGLGPTIRVADTMAALKALGLASRARSSAKIIGVTGSVGKTGVKDALHRCLARHANAHASVKSFNNDIGVPLTLARMVDWADYGIFEMGMNHAGELRDLSAMVRPHVAVVTTVASAHRAFFDSEEAIADAKAEIFEGLEKGGVAVLNFDNPHFERLKAAAKAVGADVISFGLNEGADVRGLSVSYQDNLSAIAADVAGDRLIYKVGIPGRHWVLNSLAVLAVIKVLDGDLGISGLSLSELEALPGRGRRLSIKVSQGRALLIDDAYNANPASMRAAIETLGRVIPQGRGRRIAVLGDMLELGENADADHIALTDALRAAHVAKVVGVGAHMKALIDHLEQAVPEISTLHATSHDILLDYARRRIRDGDVVLVKGSNSMGLGRFVDDLSNARHLHPRERGED